MKQLIYSHSYYNTGGHCMMSIFETRIDGKWMWVYVSDEATQILTTNYYVLDEEYDDEMLFASYDHDELKADDPYYELVRRCLNEHVKHDCTVHRSHTSLKYEALSAELQEQITDDYIEWHYMNINDYFQTNGYEVVYDECYTQRSE